MTRQKLEDKHNQEEDPKRMMLCDQRKQELEEEEDFDFRLQGEQDKEKDTHRQYVKFNYGYNCYYNHSFQI